VESVVLPNKELFAFLVGWGEFAIGISMILGLATRYVLAGLHAGRTMGLDEKLSGKYRFLA